MKLTDAGLLFAILFLCFLVMDDIRTTELWNISCLQIRYDHALDHAVEDAMFHLVELDSQREVVINKEEAVERFFNGLFINMGILDNPGLVSQMKLYIPVIVIIEQDGFWVYYHKPNARGEKKMAFSNKYKFFWEDSHYKVLFQLSDYVSVTEKKTGESLSGNYHDIEKIWPCPALSDERFSLLRRNVIVGHLMETISSYIKDHNRIAKAYGIQYEFAIPVIEREDWYRTIDDIGMIVFFQGYPYGNKRTGYYNRVGLSGARVRKAAGTAE